MSGEDTTELDALRPLHVALRDLAPGAAAPGLVAAPTSCPSARVLAGRVDALAGAPDAPAARVSLLVPGPGRPGVVIGRAGCDVIIDDPALSRRHAQVGCTTGRWWVSDLESKNGTLHEARRLPAGVQVTLASGDLLRVGRSAFVFLLEPDLVALARRVAPPPAPPAAVTLGLEGVTLRDFVELLAASGKPIERFGALFLVQIPTEDLASVAGVEAAADGALPAPAPAEREHTSVILAEGVRRLRRCSGVGAARLHSLASGRVVLGRDATSDLVLAHSSVSKRHATIVTARDGWSVVDLGSRNGTFVNGKRLPAGVSMPLRDEFQVWFGGYRAMVVSPVQLARLVEALR